MEKRSAKKGIEKTCKPSGAFLGRLYSRYALPEYIDPDPLAFLRRYSDPADVEIAALTASALAYGRVQQILKSIETVLDLMERQNLTPSGFVRKKSFPEMRKIFSKFKHRFTDGEELAMLLAGAGDCVRENGSLENTFLKFYKSSDKNVLPSLEGFASQLCRRFKGKASYLFPSPAQKSACKRPLLMLRWLVRDRDVDTGTWKKIPKNKLLVPLDTHMFSIARGFGFTKRNAPSLAAAVEITEHFAEYAPDDPVKFDFPLTRFGINPLCGKLPERGDRV